MATRDALQEIASLDLTLTTRNRRVTAGRGIDADLKPVTRNRKNELEQDKCQIKRSCLSGHATWPYRHDLTSCRDRTPLPSGAIAETPAAGQDKDPHNVRLSVKHATFVACCACQSPRQRSRCPRSNDSTCQFPSRSRFGY